MILGSAFAAIRTPDPATLMILSEAIWRVMHVGISS
jgi:hypothetical protein